MRARASDGCGLYWQKEGDGPPLMLIAGFGGTAGYWAPQAPLASRFSLLLTDQRGTGRSDPVPAGSLDQVVDDMVAVLDDAGIESAHVAGHSLGAVIALRLAARYPGRVRRLVAACARGRGDVVREKVFALRRQVYTTLGPAAHATFTSLLLYPPDFIVDHAGEIEAGERQAAATRLAPGVFDSRVELVLSSELADDLGAVRAATLVVGARDDILTPPRGVREIAEGIPGARLQLFESGGHAISRTRPAEFNQILLDFLLDTQSQGHKGSIQ